MLQSYSIFSRGSSMLWLKCQSVEQAESSISCTTISRYKTNGTTPIQTSTKEARAYIANCIIKSVPQTKFNIRIFHQGPTRCEIMTCLSILRLRSLLSTFITRVLSPENPRKMRRTPILLLLCLSRKPSIRLISFSPTSVMMPPSLPSSSLVSNLA